MAVMEFARGEPSIYKKSRSLFLESSKDKSRERFFPSLPLFAIFSPIFDVLMVSKFL